MESNKLPIIDKAQLIQDRNDWILISSVSIIFQCLALWLIVWYASKSFSLFVLLDIPILLGLLGVGVFGYVEAFKLWRTARKYKYKISFFILQVLLLICILGIAWSMRLVDFLNQWYPSAPFGGM